MSEPIIIETTTTTHERLVLVPIADTTRERQAADPTAWRDATPADLARGGYVPVERAEKAEWSARVARMAMENERQDREGVRIRKDLGAQDAPCPCDTDPEQGMGMHSPPCPLHEAARALRRKTSWEDAAHTMDGELKAAITRAEKAERERDEAILLHEERRDEEARLRERLERERDEERERADAYGATNVSLHKRLGDLDNDAHSLRAELTTERSRADAIERANAELHAELARLTAPGEGEPTDRELASLGPGTPRIDIWRAGECAGAAHERARQQPAQDRATDGDLLALAADAYRLRSREDATLDDMRKLALAVAARGRQERCLVAQAVGMPGGSFTSATIYRHTPFGAAFGVRVNDRYAENKSAAEVPATLARLLGEVSRG